MAENQRTPTLRDVAAQRQQPEQSPLDRPAVPIGGGQATKFSQGGVMDRAVERGTDEIGMTLGAAKQALGQATGWQGLEDSGTRQVEDNLIDMGANPPDMPFENVDWSNWGDVSTWALETIGAEAPGGVMDLASAATGAGIGALIARRAGGKMITTAALRQLATQKGAYRGALAGSAASNYPQNVGEMQMKFQGAAPGEDTGAEALFGGAGAAALDVAVDKLIIDRIFKSAPFEISESYLKQTTKEVLKSAGIVGGVESLTEAGQEILGNALVRAWYDPEYDIFQDVPEALAAGGLVGGGMGAGTGAAKGVVEGFNRPSVPNAPAAEEPRDGAPQDGAPPAGGATQAGAATAAKTGPGGTFTETDDTIAEQLKRHAEGSEGNREAIYVDTDSLSGNVEQTVADLGLQRINDPNGQGYWLGTREAIDRARDEILNGLRQDRNANELRGEAAGYAEPDAQRKVAGGAASQVVQTKTPGGVTTESEVVTTPETTAAAVARQKTAARPEDTVEVVSAEETINDRMGPQEAGEGLDQKTLQVVTLLDANGNVVDEKLADDGSVQSVYRQFNERKKPGETVEAGWAEPGYQPRPPYAGTPPQQNEQPTPLEPVVGPKVLQPGDEEVFEQALQPTAEAAAYQETQRQARTLGDVVREPNNQAQSAQNEAPQRRPNRFVSPEEANDASRKRTLRDLAEERKRGGKAALSGPMVDRDGNPVTPREIPPQEEEAARPKMRTERPAAQREGREPNVDDGQEQRERGAPPAERLRSEPRRQGGDYGGRGARVETDESEETRKPSRPFDPRKKTEKASPRIAEVQKKKLADKYPFKLGSPVTDVQADVDAYMRKELSRSKRMLKNQHMDELVSHEVFETEQADAKPQALSADDYGITAEYEGDEFITAVADSETFELNNRTPHLNSPINFPSIRALAATFNLKPDPSAGEYKGIPLAFSSDKMTVKVKVAEVTNPDKGTKYQTVTGLEITAINKDLGGPEPWLAQGITAVFGRAESEDVKNTGRVLYMKHPQILDPKTGKPRELRADIFAIKQMGKSAGYPDYAAFTGALGELSMRGYVLSPTWDFVRNGKKERTTASPENIVLIAWKLASGQVPKKVMNKLGLDLGVEQVPLANLYQSYASRPNSVTVDEETGEIIARTPGRMDDYDPWDEVGEAGDETGDGEYMIEETDEQQARRSAATTYDTGRVTENANAVDLSFVQRDDGSIDFQNAPNEYTEVRFRTTDSGRGGRKLTGKQIGDSLQQILDEMGLPAEFTEFFTSAPLLLRGEPVSWGGFYDPVQNRIYINEGVDTTYEGLRRTVRHELFAHYGMDTLPAKRRAELLRKMKQTRNMRWAKPYWEHVDNTYTWLDEDGKAEEVLAALAEADPEQASFWQQIKDLFMSILSEIGLIREGFTKTEAGMALDDIVAGLRRGARATPRPAQEQYIRQQVAALEKLPGAKDWKRNMRMWGRIFADTTRTAVDPLTGINQRMRRIAKDYDYRGKTEVAKSLKWIANSFDRSAGSQEQDGDLTVHAATRQITGKLLHDGKYNYDNVLKHFYGKQNQISRYAFGVSTGKSKLNEAHVKEATKLLQNETPLSQAGDASKEAKQIVRDVRAYLRRAHRILNKEMGFPVADSGENYFPRVMDQEQIRAKRNTILRRVQLNGVNIEQANKILESLLDEAPFNLDFDPSAPNAAASYSRKMPREMWEVLKEYQLNDVPSVLLRYTDTMARRAAWGQRFGDSVGDGKNAVYHPALKLVKELRKLKSEMNPADYNIIEKSVHAELGTYGVDANQAYVNASGAIIMYQNWRILAGVLFSSLPDLAYGFARSPSAKAYLKTVGRILTDKQFRDEMVHMAKVIGQVRDDLTEHIVNDQFSGQNYPVKYRKWNEKLFRYNQMHRWTNFTRTMAVSVFRESIQELVGNPNKRHQLAQLGITEADVNNWVQDGRPIGTDAWEKHRSIMAAMDQFVDEFVLRPTASSRPLLANHPYAQLFWYLKNFMWVLYDKVIRRIAREVRQNPTIAGKMAAVALPSIMAMGLAWLGFWARGVVFGRSENWDPEGTDLYWEIFQRAGFLGPLQLAVDAQGTSEMSGSAVMSLFGVTAQQIDGLMNQTWEQNVVEALPIVAISPTARETVKTALF